MAVVFVQDVESGSQDVYDRIAAATGMRDDPPVGLIIHTAGPTPTGWRNVDVWESIEAMVRFRDDRLIPAIAAAVGQLPSEPRIEITEVYDLIQP